jgi:HEAT repeat protein
MGAELRRLPGSDRKFCLNVNCLGNVSRPLMPWPRIRLVASYLALVSLFTALFVGGNTSAQICPRTEVNEPELIARIKQVGNQFEQYHPNDPNNSAFPPDRQVVYRSAAIGGSALIPVLRSISKPGRSEYDVPGAAQVSLARLGDQNAFEQLELELTGTERGGWAADKLLRVGNDKAISILMSFLVAHLADNSLYVDMGDTGSDVRYHIIDVLAPSLLNPPSEPNGNITVTLEKWATWWERNRLKPLTLAVSDDLQDPYLQCLARKVEWGFPEAILDLGAAGNPQAIPALRKLTQMGDQRLRAAGINTVRGRAQAALAKLGDPDEFKAIADELESPGCLDAVTKTQYIGGRKAVEALIESLKGTNFLVEYPDYKNDGGNAPRIKLGHDQAITNTLAKMVVSPPAITGKPGSTRLWLNWWTKNSETAELIKNPYTARE